MGAGWAYDPQGQEWFQQGSSPVPGTVQNSGILYIGNYRIFADAAPAGNLVVQAPDGTTMNLVNSP